MNKREDADGTILEEGFFENYLADIQTGLDFLPKDPAVEIAAREVQRSLRAAYEAMNGTDQAVIAQQFAEFGRWMGVLTRVIRARSSQTAE